MIRGNPELGLRCFVLLGKHKDPTVLPTIYSNFQKDYFNRLLGNVNALSIWKTLYTDQQVRTTFANEYSKKALEFADHLSVADTNATTATNKAALQQQAQDFRNNTKSFLADVNFGIGRVWARQAVPLNKWQVCYEFLGSLLTGIMVSVGAPYWHDLLRTLSNLRKRDSA